MVQRKKEMEKQVQEEFAKVRKEAENYAIGVILIVEGAINLLSALYTVLAVRRFAKLHPETQSVLESITGEDLNGDGVVAPDVAHADAEATAVELDHVDESATVEQEERE